MTNPWDQFETTGTDIDYVNLSNDGDAFEGTVKSVESKTFPAGTFDHQPFDLTVPRVVFEDEGSGEKHWDVLPTVARNAIIELRPEPGTRIRAARLGKPKGKTWIDFSVQVVGAGTPVAAPEAAAPKAEKPAPVAKPVVDDSLPPF
jgi:hypothetical protein